MVLLPIHRERAIIPLGIATSNAESRMPVTLVAWRAENAESIPHENGSDGGFRYNGTSAYTAQQPFNPTPWRGGDSL
jgi:hypothetical protein